MMICLTSASMILPKAAPITTPTAKEMTLPLNAKFLNSSKSEVFFGGGGLLLGSIGHLRKGRTWREAARRNLTVGGYARLRPAAATARQIRAWHWRGSVRYNVRERQSSGGCY